MANKIKNYTSSVSVERTIAAIEQELVKIGVSHIEKSYANGLPTGIIFSITIPNAPVLRYKIPVNSESAHDILKSIPTYRRKPKEWLRAQASRTAWRIVFNWIEIQVAMVQLQQADSLQVFLPYAYNTETGQTLYEKIRGNGYTALLNG